MTDSIDTASAPLSQAEITHELISSIRTTVLIHNEMFLRLIYQCDIPSQELIELLEDTGNAYITYSERLTESRNRQRLNKSL